jgi:NADPH-dependent ferric siderophore reductase
MTETTTRPKRRTIHTTVHSVERVTPGMVRVVVGGDDLDGFGVGEFTDHYVKL